MIAAARDLRDKYLEQYNASPAAALMATAAKYDVSREIEATPVTKQLAA